MATYLIAEHYEISAAMDGATPPSSLRVERILARNPVSRVAVAECAQTPGYCMFTRKATRPALPLLVLLIPTTYVWTDFAIPSSHARRRD